jgi:hypothetical protein
MNYETPQMELVGKASTAIQSTVPSGILDGNPMLRQKAEIITTLEEESVPHNQSRSLPALLHSPSVGLPFLSP